MEFAYDASYPQRRGHGSATVGQLKVRSLKRWIAELGLNLSGLRVCEVGFGAGWTLAYLRGQARKVYGAEAISENNQSAISLGLEPSCLFDATRLPHSLPESIDLWLYQDSFEHILDPSAHLEWVARNSSAGALALLVLPEAGSLSEKMLGGWWPHRIADHAFHWSRPGLENIWGQFGFGIIRRFHPVKCVTIGMMAAHTAHRLRFGLRPSLAGRGPSLWFNIGEQGLLLRREG